MNEQKSANESLLTQNQLAIALQVHITTIRRWEKKGLPTYRVTAGAHPRYLHSEVVAWLKKQKGE